MKEYITGKVTLTERGQLEIAGWYQLTEGTIFELNINGTWVKTQVCGHKISYYALGMKGLDLRGRLARVKA